MYVCCMTKKRGQDKFASYLLAEGTNPAEYVKSMPGVDKPYLVFASFPDGPPSSANLLDPSVPKASNDTAVNQAAIDAMLEHPRWDLLA